MSHRILICGDVNYAQEELKTLFSGLAEIIHIDSETRADFLSALQPSGKYAGIVGIYRSNISSKRIGRFDKEIIDGLPSSVKWIAHKGAGYDQIDVQACKAKGIAVSHTPDVVNESTATTALFLIIAASRQFSQGERSLRAGTWKTPIHAGNTHDLTGRTLGILGLGGIGLHLAHLVHAFPMRIIYHSRSKKLDAPEWCEYYESLEEMLRITDVLSVHLPLRKDTEGFIGEKEIRLLKRGSILVNTARGKVVDEGAMIRALEDGHLESVGLDVFANEPNINPELLKFPQATLLPHLGTSTLESSRNLEARALTNLRDFLTKGKGDDLVPEMR